MRMPYTWTPRSLTTCGVLHNISGMACHINIISVTQHLKAASMKHMLLAAPETFWHTWIQPVTVSLVHSQLMDLLQGLMALLQTHHEAYMLLDASRCFQACIVCACQLADDRQAYTTPAYALQCTTKRAARTFILLGSIPPQLGPLEGADSRLGAPQQLHYFLQCQDTGGTCVNTQAVNDYAGQKMYISELPAGSACYSCRRMRPVNAD